MYKIFSLFSTLPAGNELLLTPNDGLNEFVIIYYSVEEGEEVKLIFADPTSYKQKSQLTNQISPLISTAPEAVLTVWNSSYGSTV